MSVDALWEKGRDVSLYQYSHLNPIRQIDPDGQWSIDIYACKDRDANPYGSGVVKDQNGNVVFTFVCRLEGQGSNRLLEDGDTPFGVYKIYEEDTWRQSTKGERAGYGPNARLQFVGIAGEVVESASCEKPREINTLRIHGGRQEEKGNEGKLEKTHGCIRVYDSDIKKMQEITEQLMKNNPNEKPGLLRVTPTDECSGGTAHPTNTAEKHPQP